MQAAQDGIQRAADRVALTTAAWTDRAVDWLVGHGLTFGVALLVLAVGFPVTGYVTRWILRHWERKGLDPSLHYFLGSLLLWSMRIGLLLLVGAMAGLEVTAFVAVLGGFAFAIGMALQGSLSNFAGGILILVLRPFRVGDVIETQGFSGTVTQIRVFNTRLRTADNRVVIFPNGPLSNGTLVNYTLEKTRRVDITVGIGYGCDVAGARAVVLRCAAADPRILKDPPPEVLLGALADSSVNLFVRVWARTEDHPAVLFALQEAVKAAFDAEGIEIPFPQRVVQVRGGALPPAAGGA